MPANAPGVTRSRAKRYQTADVRSSSGAFAAKRGGLTAQLPIGIMGDVTEPEALLLGDGWLRVRWPDRSYSVMVQTEEEGGRRVVRELVIRDQRIDSNTLKTLPIGWIESLVNSPDPREKIAEQDRHGSKLGLVLTELDLLIDAMASAPAEAFSAGPPREPLTRPDGTDPNLFYRSVAEAYTDVLRRTSAIAPVLAEEAGVPVATVHRWIGEARRRGFLPPARKGRAG